MNYLSKPIKMKVLPSGFEPEITALRGQYAWPDYTTGACKNENELQFKAIAGSHNHKENHLHLH